MHSYVPVRRVPVLTLALAGMLFIAGLAAAQTPAKPVAVAKYSATAVNLKRVNGETITFDVTRWSTDEERDKVVAAFAKSPAEALTVLQGMPSLGIVWRSGSSFGYFIRYATRVKGADGRDRVILAVDRDLEDWNLSFSGDKPAAPTSPFTLIELRTGKGPGEGKMSLGSKIQVEAASKTLAIEAFEKAAVVLKNVK